MRILSIYYLGSIKKVTETLQKVTLIGQKSNQNVLNFSTCRYKAKELTKLTLTCSKFELLMNS